MLTLRPYQQAAIDAIYAYFAEKAGHPLVVIPTAGGKSLVMASFIEGVLKAWPDQRILVVNTCPRADHFRSGLGRVCRAQHKEESRKSAIGQADMAQEAFRPESTAERPNL